MRIKTFRGNFRDIGRQQGEIYRKNNLFYDPDDAINDKGLFIGLTFAHDNKWSYGLSCTHMIKLIAETCPTVKDALKVFKRVPLCYPKNFFIADDKGNMAVVEHTSSKRFRIVYPENGVLIHTNHYLDAGLAKEDRVLAEEPSHNTFVRYYEALRKINQRKEKFQLSDIMKILGNTSSCVCQTGPNFQTIWSLALDMKKRRYKLYWDITSNRNARNIRI